jgi:hypothetical protein
MRIPANKISYGYTAGKEYKYKKSGNFYIGYYYKLYNKFYAGKEFNPEVKSLEIVDIKKIKAINNPNSFLYNFLAGAKSGLGSPFVLTKKPTKSQALESIQAANKQGFLPVVGVNFNADGQALQANADEQQRQSTPVQVKRYFFRQLIRVIGLHNRINDLNDIL